MAGFDNQDIVEYFIPGLTTMDLPLIEIGHTAARLLLQRLEGEKEEEEAGEQILLPCSLIERDSVQPV